MSAAKPCSAELSRLLYHRLEYYFEYAPVIFSMSKEAYDATAEGKQTKEALERYRSETGT